MIEKVLSQFRELQTAIIDASSILYMHKAGFLSQLTNTLNLFSLPEILAETGYSDLNIKSFSIPFDSISNDQKLITCALRQKWPAISEDKKILLFLDRQNHPYFNSLMMLNFLLFKKRISLELFSTYFARLKKHAWYSPSVFEFGRKIHDSITNISP